MKKVDVMISRRIIMRIIFFFIYFCLIYIHARVYTQTILHYTQLFMEFYPLTFNRFAFHPHIHPVLSSLKRGVRGLHGAVRLGLQVTGDIF